jgi:hypothetical protein
MSVWADAFDAAYAVDPPNFATLAGLVSSRVGQTIDPAWIAASVDEIITHVLHEAPCREDEWTDPTLMPPPVQAVVASVLSRVAANPQGVRTIQMGEFSQTWAGSVTGIIARQSGCGGGGLLSVETEPTTVLDLSNRTL